MTTQRRKSRATLLGSALAYVESGLSVFPLAPGTKIPLARSNGFKDATDDIEKVKQWWTENPSANIGIATGSISGIFVIDIDMKNGKDGEASWAEVCAEFPVPSSMTVLTPLGGRHLYFRLPAGSTVPCKAGLFEGVDVRGDGGYIVAPPSITPHGTYRLEEVPDDC